MERIMANSNFLQLYGESDSEPQFIHHVLYSLERTIFIFAEQNGAGKAEAYQMFKAIENETLLNALTSNNAVAAGITGIALETTLNQVQLFAVRLWTSTINLHFPNGRDVEICGMINDALRRDDPVLLQHVIVLVKAINQLCVTKRAQGKGAVVARWPSDFTTFRGGRLPDDHHEFFTVGKKYRCPTLLATSCKKTKALEFMMRQPQPRLLWIIRVDPVYRCVNVNYIEEFTNVPGEKNFYIQRIVHLQ